MDASAKRHLSGDKLLLDSFRLVRQFEAEDEAQEWPELHAAIRDPRTRYQAGEQMPDWQALENLITPTRECRSVVVSPLRG